jgi:hypothetical protein
MSRFVIPANAGIQLLLLLSLVVLILISTPVAGAEQRRAGRPNGWEVRTGSDLSRTAGKGAAA